MIHLHLYMVYACIYTNVPGCSGCVMTFFSCKLAWYEVSHFRNPSISDAPSRAEYDPKLGTKLPKNSVGVEVEVGAMRSIQILGRNKLESLFFSHFEGVVAFPCKISFEHLKRKPPFCGFLVLAIHDVENRRKPTRNHQRHLCVSDPSLKPRQQIALFFF